MPPTPMLFFQVKLSSVLGQPWHRRVFLLLGMLWYIGFDILFKYLFISISERKGWESWDYLAWRREVSGETLSSCYKYLMGGRRDDGGRLCSVVHRERAKGDGHELQRRTFHWNVGSNFQCEGCRTLEEVAQRCCGVSVPGDTQNPTGHSPGACSGWPCAEQGLGRDALQSCLPASAALWSCETFYGWIYIWKGREMNGAFLQIQIKKL